MSAAIDIRPLRASYKADWRRLWAAYLAFYETTVSEEVYATTFERLLGDAPYDPSCLLAVKDDQPVGLVHYLAHRHCWRTENVVYLQDLFAHPDMRGQGVGRRLIEAVYAAVDAAGMPSVYWMTNETNYRGRMLYDRIGTKTPFIKYLR